MIKAIFFDWFNTLAHYYPPREELESQALKELGFAVSPKALSPVFIWAISIYTKKMRVFPSGRETAKSRTKLYTRFHRIILKEAGITADDAVVSKLLFRMFELNNTHEVRSF